MGPEVFVSTFILKFEKNDSKLAPILGAGKRLPKWESAPLLLQKQMRRSDCSHFGVKKRLPKRRPLCVLFLKVLAFRKRNLIICKRKFLNSGLNPLLAKWVSLSAIQDI